ncbi:hypothetical protein GCM10007868_10050 [Gluconobacter frateurii]|nr:hypothetical protein GCM10007868_10050 [Gluconobacter frateurii]
MLSFCLSGREESDPIVGRAEDLLYHSARLYAFGAEGPKNTGHRRPNGIYMTYIHWGIADADPYDTLSIQPIAGGASAEDGRLRGTGA